jgi:hypothetical protein
VLNLNGSRSVGPVVASSTTKLGALHTGVHHLSTCGGGAVAAGEPIGRRQSSSSPCSLTVHQPQLWWVRGFGEQPMYVLSVSVGGADADADAPVVADSLSRPFGIRDLRQVRNPGPDSWSYIEEFYCGPGEHTGAPPDGGGARAFHR